MEDLISVIVPVYNTKEYLSQCITSILEQSYSKLEVLLIDDGSDDGSADVCDSFAKRDERIRVWHQKNLGVSASRNFALSQARGKWISFVDSDDWLDNSMYEEMIHLQQRTSATTVCCGAWNCVGTKREVSRTWRKFEGEEHVYNKKEALGGILSQSGTLWNKLFLSVIAKNIFFDTKLRYGEDMLFLAKYLTLADDVVVTKQPYYFYRIIREGNVVSAKLNDRHLDYFKSTEILVELLCDQFEETAAVERCVDVIVRVFRLIPIRKATKENVYIKGGRKLANLTRPIEKQAFNNQFGLRIFAKKIMLFLARDFAFFSVVYAKIFYVFSKR